MKKILILLVILSLTSCRGEFESHKDRKARIEKKYNMCNFNLEIEYITGTVERVSYTLPEPSELVVQTNKGSYELVQIINVEGEEYPFYDYILAGVVRYKLLSKTCE